MRRSEGDRESIAGRSFVISRERELNEHEKRDTAIVNDGVIA